MSANKPDTAVNAAGFVISEDIEPAGETNNADLTTAQPEAANANEFTTKKLPPPAGDVVPAWPERRKIRVADGEQATILDAIEEFVGARYYSRASRIVRIDGGQIFNCAPSFLATEIARHCDVERYDGRSKDYRKTDLNEKYTTAFLQRERWPSVRPLDALVRSPFVREDCSIVDQPGYDPQSGCFGAFDPYEFSEPGSSEEEAHAALEILLAPFDQIPFETEAALSAFLALLLTQVARIALRLVPGFLISAPDKGSGKTMLCKIAEIIAQGGAAAVRTWPNTPEELRKTLFAALLAGERSMLFDNVREGVKLHSAELAAFITAENYKDRVLGASENVVVPNKAVLIINGNNVNPTADLARRFLVVRLNAGMPGAELRKRTFKIPDLEQYVTAHRAELLVAALTIIKAHQQSGHVGPTVLPSFGGWSRMVRDPLIWLGLPDPCETQTETDDGSNTLAEAFSALAPKLGGRQFTPSDVQGLTMFDKQLSTTLHDAGCFDPSNPQRIGYWLRENRDRFGGDFRLRLVASSAASHHGSKCYQFVHVPGPNADLVGDAA